VRILSVVGNRPQFIKSGPLSLALRGAGVGEVVVHTGQHWDAAMSAVFFDELGLPEPAYRLDLRTADPAAMVPAIRAAIESEQPDWVLVYGDTNSTLAGSLVAAKLHMPIAHVEAGLRSFDRRMPEEVNRVVSDHLSALKFCPTETGVRNLAREGVVEGVHLVGDVMYDSFVEHLAIARRRRPAALEDPAFKKGFALATIHRPENTDDPSRLRAIVNGLDASGMRVLFPAHPRTRAALETAQLTIPSTLKMIEPVGYLDMIALEEAADVIVTDSGGVQKEAYFVGRPCVTVRETTEWPETVDAGWNTLVGADAAGLAQAVASFRPKGDRPLCFGDGHATEKILSVLTDAASQSG